MGHELDEPNDRAPWYHVTCNARIDEGLTATRDARGMLAKPHPILAAMRARKAAGSSSQTGRRKRLESERRMPCWLAVSRKTASARLRQFGGRARQPVRAIRIESP